MSGALSAATWRTTIPPRCVKESHAKCVHTPSTMAGAASAHSLGHRNGVSARRHSARAREELAAFAGSADQVSSRLSAEAAGTVGSAGGSGCGGAALTIASISLRCASAIAVSPSGSRANQTLRQRTHRTERPVGPSEDELTPHHRIRR